MRLHRVSGSHTLRGAAYVAAVVLLSSGGCEKDPVGPTDPPPVEGEPLVSDPVLMTLSASAARALGLASAELSRAAEVAYVSLPPGSIPDAERATIRKEGSTTTLTTVMIDGGFDPVPVLAAPGEIVEVEAQVGSTFRSYSLRVPKTRSPRVVRSYPPPKKRDVALNQSLVIIFSEPVAERSLTPSSVRLFRGSTQVVGIVHLLDGVTAAAVFEPRFVLEPNTDYRLVVEGVQDLEGERLVPPPDLEFTTGIEYTASVEGLNIVPDATALDIGSQVQLTALPTDSAGSPLAGLPVAWTIDNPFVATISPTGLVIALGTGSATVSAQVRARTATALIQVAASLPPVAAVRVDPRDVSIPLGPAGGAVQLTADTRDAGGNFLPFRQVTWSSSNSAVARVTAGSRGRGVVTIIAAGTATITATSEGVSDAVEVTTVTPGRYAAIDARGAGYNSSQSCGLTTDSWILCWGGNDFGQLGIGSQTAVFSPIGLGGRRFSEVASLSTRTCALDLEGKAYCWGSDSPFNGPSSGIAPDRCVRGASCSLAPMAVHGDHQFSHIALGESHICALTPSGAAYCWGTNSTGLLGTGSTTGPEQCGSVPNAFSCSLTPVAVTGGLTFTTIATGGAALNGAHTCALTASGDAYCWGENRYGQLGDGTQLDRSSPTLVPGGRSFAAISVGFSHTCALTGDGTAYCWGLNSGGNIGVGTMTGPERCGDGTPCSRVPVPVATTLRWTSISTSSHSCAVAVGGAAYCWGTNWRGQLGSGTTVSAAVPEPVVGGLAFATVSSGAGHTCGVTTGGIAYCWGYNGNGGLGDGTTNDSAAPVKVAGQP